MGAIVTALGGVCRALSCDSLNMYVLNDCSLRLECGGETCCELEVVTRPVTLQSASSEEIDVDLDRAGLHVKKI
jgi:hypothetical protein